jgi:hypothetical protein
MGEKVNKHASVCQAGTSSMLGCNFELISRLPRLYDLLQRSRASVSSITNVTQVRAERVLICRLGRETL